MSDTRVATRPYIVGPAATHFITPAGGPVFPTSPAPIFRYLADTGVTTSGANVTQVLDQSGNGYTLTNSGTVPFDATGLNGRPCFAFNNTGGLATASLSINMGTASPGPRSFFFVGTLNNTSPFGAELMGMIGTAAHNDYDGGAGDVIMGRQGSNNFYIVQNVATTDTFSLDVGYRFGVVNTGGTWQWWRNGVTVGTPGVMSAANSATCMLSIGRGIRVGAPSAGVDYFGKVQEFIGYAVALTAPQVAALDSYLSSKWGV